MLATLSYTWAKRRKRSREKGKTTPVGIPCVRPQSDMRCYQLDRCDIESGSWQCTSLGEAILFSIKHSSCVPYQVCVGGRQAVFILVLCAIMKLCRELGLFGTILSFGSLISFILSVSMDISFLDVSFMDILQVMIYSFGIFSSLGISLYFGLSSWKSWACIFTSCSLFGMLSFFDPIYRGNSTKSQIGWDVHEIHFHIYMHIFMWSLSYVLLVL